MAYSRLLFVVTNILFLSLPNNAEPWVLMDLGANVNIKGKENFVGLYLVNVSKLKVMTNVAIKVVLTDIYRLPNLWKVSIIEIKFLCYSTRSHPNLNRKYDLFACG